MKKSPTPNLFFLAALLACGGLFGCEDIISALGLESTGARQLSDDDAFAHLRTNYQSSPSSDLKSISQVIDDEVQAADVEAKTGKKMRKKSAEDSDDVINLKRSVIHARKTINTAKFDRIDDEFFKRDQAQKRVFKGAADAYKVDLSTLKGDEYFIPNADKIPVRDQAQRGTCASFAGIGTIEYSALKNGASELPTLNLSEQRFYWLSRQDLLPKGGTSADGGSHYYNGFEESANATELDIPLETDCPYDGTWHDNELQVPQKSSCSKGAVKVDGDGFMYETGAQGIVNLLNKGYAVPFASPLSSNWENNNGLITKKDFTSQGSSVHAGGHAYLIVGYRKISNSGEGGMCFIVKNSWGTGWGVKGFACQTLAWTEAIDRAGYQTLQYEDAIIVPTALELREDLQNTSTLPDDNTDAEDEVAPMPPEEQDDDALPPEEDEVEPPKTLPDESDYVDANLLGNTEEYYRVQVATLDDKFFVRGVLRSTGDNTTAIALEKKGSALYYDGDEVGKFTNNTLTLCSGEWGHLCSLRYKDSASKLYLQFRDDDLRSVKDEEVSSDKGEWYDVDLETGEYGLFVPNAESAAELLFDPKVYLKLGSSEVSRLSLKVNAWNKIGIRLQGEEVGELNLTKPLDSSLCSGDYADTCSVIGKDKLHIFPSNTKKNNQ